MCDSSSLSSTNNADSMSVNAVSGGNSLAPSRDEKIQQVSQYLSSPTFIVFLYIYIEVMHDLLYIYHWRLNDTR